MSHLLPDNMLRYQIIRTFDHLNTINDWITNGLVIEKLKGSGFDRFSTMRFPTRMKHCLSLFDCLVHYYNVEKRIFIFNGIPFVITLKDVLYITGLPVDGKGLGEPVGDENLSNKALYETYLNAYNENERSDSMIDLKWLKDKFMDVPANKSSEELDCYVRAYVLYLIGIVVVPTKNNGKVSTKYLKYLSDIDNIKSYAWGAALLANLHDYMEAAKKQIDEGKANINIGGSVFVLECFIVEYIPSIASMVLQTSSYRLPMELPLMVHWAKEFKSKCSSVSASIKSNQREEFVKIVNSLKDEDGNIMEDKINWTPYERFENPDEGFEHNDLWSYYSAQNQLGRSRTFLLDRPGKSKIRHSPQEQPKQFGMESVNNLPELVAKCEGMTEVEEWCNRWELLISDDVEAENDMVSDNDLNNDFTRSPLLNDMSDDSTQTPLPKHTPPLSSIDGQFSLPQTQTSSPMDIQFSVHMSDDSPQTQTPLPIHTPPQSQTSPLPHIDVPLCPLPKPQGQKIIVYGRRNKRKQQRVPRETSPPDGSLVPIEPSPDASLTEEQSHKVLRSRIVPPRKLGFETQPSIHRANRGKILLQKDQKEERPRRRRN